MKRENFSDLIFLNYFILFCVTSFNWPKLKIVVVLDQQFIVLRYVRFSNFHFLKLTGDNLISLGHNQSVEPKPRMIRLVRKQVKYITIFLSKNNLDISYLFIATLGPNNIENSHKAAANYAAKFRHLHCHIGTQKS